jgi:hypothetical protein
MARFLATAVLAAALMLPASAVARGGGRAHRAHASGTTHRHGSAATAPAHRSIRHPSTNPVELALRLAERYWGGVPACGTPAVLTSPHQLPIADYEDTTGPEPANSVVEMWTEVQKCTITINTSIWGGWHQDDESFQWFCDAMTHEVGHLFGHLDGGQTDASSITYPFLDETSPNFNSVPECQGVTLHYGSQEIRNHEVVNGR